MRRTPRFAPTTLGIALLAAFALATPALAHEGHPHDEGSGDAWGVTFADRAEAMTTAARVESARRRAPDAVDGQCLRTVDVPLQGASCDLGDGMWGVLQPDGTTAQTHGPDVYAAGSPIIDLDPADASRLAAAGDIALNPLDSDYVTCETNPRVPRTVVVFAKPPNVTYTGPQVVAITERIRGEIRKVSEFVRAQAEVDRAAAVGEDVTFRVQCVGSSIDVKVVDIADPERDQFDDPTFAGIEAAIRAKGVLGADDAGRIVAYAPFDLDGVAGQGWVYDDPTPDRDNLNNGEDQFAAHYLANAQDDPTSPDGIDWDIFLHEMLHNMGAVNNAAAVPDGNGTGHCTSDADVMCYDEPGRPTITPRRCAETQLDCGRDTYFNASDAPVGWLATHWNAGSTTNRYLDFGDRSAPLDIVAPTRPTGLTLTSTVPNTVDVAWTPSTDDGGGAVLYDVLHGASSPTQEIRNVDRTRGRVSNVPAGTRRFWVIAYDANRNASVMSAPVTVQVTAPEVAKPVAPAPAPPAPEPDRTAPVAITAPPPPVDLRVTTIRPGTAVLAWKPGEGTSADASYRVELLDADTKAWQLATIPSTGTTATVQIRPGTTARARIVVRNEAGAARSGDVRFATSVRGASCRWVAADATAPVAPKRTKVKVRTARIAKATFAPATDANGVCAVRLLVRVGTGPWRPLPGALSGAARAATFTGLKPRSAVQLALEAVDARGNVSPRTILRTRTP